METQTSPTVPKLSQGDSAPNPKNRKVRPTPSVATKAARREASRNYRWKNEEELREKARIRMAARRKALKESGYVSEEHSERVKKAHATYRAKKGTFLAFRARLRRQEAFIAKHGADAYQERIKREQARSDAAWEAKMAEARVKEQEARQDRLAHPRTAPGTM